MLTERSRRSRRVLRRRLTKSVVDGLKLTKQERFVWDTDLKRFALRIYPSGTKTYLLRLRADGRQRWYTIGQHGDPWTVETAREEARRVLGQAANVRKLRETGAAPPTLLHPVEAREQTRTGTTLAVFARRYIEDHAVPHKAPGTVEADRGLLGLRDDRAGRRERKPRKQTRRILHTLGSKRVDRVTRADVVKLHLAWKDTPTKANRAVALLSHIFTMAEKWGVRSDGSNPCRHVERFKETRRERFLSAQELAKLGAALADADSEGNVSPFAISAIRLLIFTGARAGEVLGLTWDAVDASGGAVRVPRKGRMLTLYLPPPALEVLAKLPRVEDTPYVIVGRRRTRPPAQDGPLSLAGLEQVWQVVRKAADLEDVRLHDLRHSFASVAVAAGASLPLIGGLLGHTQPSTTARYAHLSADPLRAAAEATAGTIAAAMKAKPKKRRNVTAMRRRR